MELQREPIVKELKEKHLEYQRKYQRDHYWKYKAKALVRRTKAYHVKKEFKIFLNILLD